jgi:hypothetical protein
MNGRIEWLKTRLASSDEEIIWDTCEEIGRGGYTELAPLLLAIISCDDRIQVLNAAALALSDLRVHESVPVLLCRIQELKEKGGTLVYALHQLDCTEIVAELVTLALTGSYEIRMMAELALEHIGRPVAYKTKQWALTALDCALSQSGNMDEKKWIDEVKQIVEGYPEYF